MTVAGLGGDERQSRRFIESIGAVRRFGFERLELPASQVIHATPLGQQDQPTLNASAQDVDTACRQIAPQMTADDVVWFVVFAHGSRDVRGVSLHLAGPDPPAQQWARWLDALPAKHQVVVLAGSGAGWLLKPLARPGRVVITATDDDDEFNATEFPHAFSQVLAQPAAQLDHDHDRQVTLAELFAAVSSEVERRFAADQRIATEHAQLDADGDGRSIEVEVVRRWLDQRKPRTDAIAGASDANTSDAAVPEEAAHDLLAASNFPFRLPVLADKAAPTEPSPQAKPDESRDNSPGAPSQTNES